ncbi:acetylcholine receptor subunit alpha-L1-like isoform X1 [Musca domestica]|uniref:Acetylcholine receptor subunit alpha-L1-like isoform X1 n=1 Tax=Musca domestica TaxID=7370 RepID=A0A1I8NBA9_MUSDO|nr:acetylcholine receptor subunit alpha-L1-like isoform X1 [Musca domestica]
MKAVVFTLCQRVSVKIMLALSICFAFAGVIASASGADHVSTGDMDRDLLKKTLLANYHPSSRPVQGLNETVMLFVNIEMQHFDFLEKNGAFHLVGLLHVRWRDPKLVWNPSDYGNITYITVNQRHIWIPDLEFYNNAPNKFIRMHRNGFVSVKQNGVVFWSDAIDVNIFCTKDMTFWPHDRHECHLVLGSWTFDGFEVDIMHVNANESMSFTNVNRQNMEYKVTGYNASHVAKYYPCCLYPYTSVDYNITFQRESSYAVIFRCPAISIAAFTIFSLCLEPTRTETFWINAISLWLASGELIYFSFNGQHFSRGAPNIVIFFGVSFVMVTMSQLVAVFSIFANRSTFKTNAPLPARFSRWLNSPFVLRLLSKKSGSNMAESCKNNCSKTDDISHLIDKCNSSNDWQLLANLLQRSTCFSFSLIYLILFSIYFV